MTEEAKEIKSPFFSVIIPVYNKEPHIARSINSVLNQTFQNFELIIVCDPSTDNSNTEVAKFTDPRIRVYYRDKPGPGGYAARNLGIKEAKAEWIAFLDADDEYFPGYLSHTKSCILENGELKIFSSSKIIEKDGGSEIDVFSKNIDVESGVFTFEQYLKFSINWDKPFNTNSVIAHRCLFVGGCFFPHGKTKRSGDIILWVYLVASAKKFYWSNFIGSCTHKDVVGVSKSSTPSLNLPRLMVEDLKSDSKEEEKLLKKYSNRLVKTAALEQKRIDGRLESKIYGFFYWDVEFFYPLFWSLYCSQPVFFIKLIDKARRLTRFFFKRAINF
ncbi:glycosyltransferase family A protein [Marinospirillum sp.]|uniref:glycosyltransferase family A protein n=1 Tax=Marinospirillum sp. TaxID=2183934 RepID=UPI00384A5719